MLGLEKVLPAHDPINEPNPHAEYGRIEGVMDAFLRKHTLLQNAKQATGAEKEQLEAQAKKIFCGVLWGGGAFAVGTQIGFAELLYNLGFTQDGTINVYVGMSGGSIVGAHGAIGDFDAADILPEAVDGGFVAKGRQRRWSRPWQRLDYRVLTNVLGRHRLRKDRLAQTATDIYAITVEIDRNGKDHKLHAHNLKEAEDPDEVLHASSHIPFFSMQGATILGGVLHNDGTLLGYPIEVMDGLVPKDAEEINWLIINALPLGQTEEDYKMADRLDQVGRRLWDPVHRVGLSFLKAHLITRTEILKRHWNKWSRGKQESYAFIEPSRQEVGPYTQDQGKLIQAVADSRRAALTFAERFFPGLLENIELSEQSA